MISMAAKGEIGWAGEKIFRPFRKNREKNFFSAYISADDSENNKKEK